MPTIKMLEWLDRHWMFLAPPLTLTLIVYKFVLSKPKQFDDKRIQDFVLWGYLSMLIYSFHQFEEHGYDVYGRRYHFIEYFNEIKPLDLEMTPRFITIINLVEVHLVFYLFATYTERTGNPLPAVLSHSISCLNAAMAHIMPGLLKQSYNPGLLQSLFMAPLSAAVLYKFYLYQEKSLKAVLICILFGSAYGHGIALLLPLKLCAMGILNEFGFFICVQMMQGSAAVTKQPKKDGVHAVYNLREVAAPVLKGIPLLLFSRLIRSSLGSFILSILKKDNDIPCIVRLAESILKEWMPQYYPLPEKHDEVRYNKHVELSKGFQLDEFAASTTANTSSKEEDFRYHTAQDYVEKYKSGELTPYQVAWAVIKATNESNNTKPVSLNAIVQMKEDDLLQQAKESSERYKNKKTLGPLDGVPVVIKDECDVKGYPTTFGTKFLATLNGEAKEDSPLVAKLRQGGALLAGKTNMHECGIGTTGYNWHFGPARNPHNLDHFTGGSSSGSAAAVAAGLVPLALGFDGGGSIRIPSALCGVVGFKPTFKRCDMDMPVCPSLGHAGPIACSVKDAAIGYAIMAGPNENANESGQHVGIPIPPVHLGSFSNSVKGLKVGIFDEFFNDAHPEIVELCSKAVKNLETQGAQVVKISLPHMEEVKIAHAVTVSTELACGYSKYFRKHMTKFTPESRISFTLGQSFSSSDFLAAQKVRRYAMHTLEEAFSQVDVILSPATGCTAPELPKSVVQYGQSNLGQTAHLMRYIYHGNLCGIPGVAVPVGYSSSNNNNNNNNNNKNNKNLPVSLLIQARHWEEDVLMQVAQACEANVVEHKKPKVHFDILEMAKAEPRE
ncbi:MAG: hypothetical protein SGBAC_009129 [Bacillariaceae sp.]